MPKKKIWIFSDEYLVEHEFDDPYEMMKYMWHHYIEENVGIGWRIEKSKVNAETSKSLMGL